MFVPVIYIDFDKKSLQYKLYINVLKWILNNPYFPKVFKKCARARKNMKYEIATGYVSY